MFNRLGPGLGVRGRAARQCPAPRILDPAKCVPAHAPVPCAVAFRRRQQQGAQTGEAVRADPAGGHQLAQRVFQLRPQQAGVHQQLVEEQRTMLAQRLGHGLGARRQQDVLRLARGDGRPDGHLPPGQQHDRRTAHRPATTAAAAAQPAPGDAAGTAQLVQPADRVIAHARWQDLRFPRAGRGLVTFQLCQRGDQRIGAVQAGGRRHVLPVEQEAHQRAPADRLDLAAQPADGVTVDACQQMALAPFGVTGVGGEAALHYVAFGLQPQQRLLDFAGLDVEGLRQSVHGDRAESAEAVAHEFQQRVLARPGLRGVFGGCGDRRLHRCRRMQRLPQRKLFGRRPHIAEPGGALRLRQRLQSLVPVGVGGDFIGGDETQQGQRLVHLVGVAHLRPGFPAHGGDRVGIEPAQIVGAVGVVPAARLHGLGAALLQRRVVEEGVRRRVQHLGGERAGCGEVACDDGDLAGLQLAQDRQQAVHVHRLAQAVVQGLVDQRVIRHLALAHDVFQAGDLIGEHRGEQVLALHPLQRRRGFLATGEARQRQRGHRIPAPARGEQRRVEQGLNQHMLGGVRVQVMRHFLQRKAVAGRQRQHDRVLGRRRLQLEVELAAEALAQRQPPRAVDAAAPRRVDHQLGAAGFVEEALQHQRVLARQHAERGFRAGEVIGQLLSGGVGKAKGVPKPFERGRFAPLSPRERGWG